MDIDYVKPETVYGRFWNSGYRKNHIRCAVITWTEFSVCIIRWSHTLLKRGPI